MMMNLPLEMVFDHGDHGVLNVLLVGGEVGAGVLLFELGGQLLADEVRVADLFAVQFDEG